MLLVISFELNLDSVYLHGQSFLNLFSDILEHQLRPPFGLGKFWSLFFFSYHVFAHMKFARFFFSLGILGGKKGLFLF